MRVAQVLCAERAPVHEVEEILVARLDPIQFVVRKIGDAAAKYRSDAVVGRTAPAALGPGQHPALAEVDRGDAGPFHGIGHTEFDERRAQERLLSVQTGTGGGYETQHHRGFARIVANHAVGFQPAGRLEVLRRLGGGSAKVAISG